MTRSEVASVRAEALFVSSLQRSDNPTPDDVRAAVSASLHRHGPRGCAAEVAQEFGEHPAESVWRMSWVLAEVELAYAGRSLGRHGRHGDIGGLTSAIDRQRSKARSRGVPTAKTSGLNRRRGC